MLDDTRVPLVISNANQLAWTHGPSGHPVGHYPPVVQADEHTQ